MLIDVDHDESFQPVCPLLSVQQVVGVFKVRYFFFGVAVVFFLLLVSLNLKAMTTFSLST